MENEGYHFHWIKLAPILLAATRKLQFKQFLSHDRGGLASLV